MKDKMETTNAERDPSLDNQILTGSAWMTMGSLTSKVLGALYIILWFQWMGGGETAAAANGLYQMAYNPYNFFLMLATAGIPSAISKSVSRYNAMQEYETAKSIYKQGLKIMLITGVLSAIFMYIFAPWFASTGPSANIEDGIIVMRSLAPALLLIPAQSVTRGLIQGHNRMREPAISQIVEQVVRVIFILTSVYLIRQVYNGSAVTAVAFSTFAAFVGAIASFSYLLIRLRSIPTVFNKEPSESLGEVNVSPNELIKEIIKTSIPFIIVSTGVVIFQIIDQQTYAPLMRAFTNVSDEQIQITYGITQANAHKLSMILTSFGSALAITSVPLISTLTAQNNTAEVRRQFSKGIRLLFFIMFPASLGMLVVAEPLYAFFYDYSPLGIQITQVYAIVSIVLALYIMLGNICQSANLQRPAIIAVAIGFVVKIVTQPLFIWLGGPFGMLISTFFGLGVTIVLMMRAMYISTRFSVKILFRRSLLSLLVAVVMAIIVLVFREALRPFLDFHSRTQGLIATLILAAIGVIVYMYMSMKLRIADELLGDKVAVVREKLNIK